MNSGMWLRLMKESRRKNPKAKKKWRNRQKINSFDFWFL